MQPELRFPGFKDPWHTKTLKQLCEWSKGSDLQKDKLNYEGKGELALHYAQLFSFGNFIFPKDIVTYTESNEGVYIPLNSLLFADSCKTPSALAITSAIDTPNVRASSGTIIGSMNKRTDASFISFQLNWKKHLFTPYITGTGVGHISAKGLSCIKVNVTSLEEQQKIGNFFKDIDEIISESKKVNKVFLEIRNSLAYQMTANSLEEAPNLRFSSYKEKWKRVLLSDIVEIMGGGTPLTTNPEFWEGGTVNWFTPAEIENNKVYISDSERKITEAGLKSSSAKILPINSVLFTSRASIGKAAILSAEASTNQGFQSFIPKEGKSLTYFIYLLTARVKDFALKNATGTTFLEVSSSTLKSMLVRIPSLEEQEKIAKLFADLDKLYETRSSYIKNIELLKQALLQRMFI
nr:restriction endonuclease subunit S [Psittacicella melopsittaci]